mgnify:CR=1 FL=1
MNLKRILGVVLLILGIFITGSNFAYTGAVIGVNSSVSFFGIILFIAGIFLLMSERGEPGELEGITIIETPRFQRAIKKHDVDSIRKAIAKIGTGKGKEEKIQDGRGYSIRESKGGRIIFEYKPDHSVVLLDYSPGSKHYRR